MMIIQTIQHKVTKVFKPREDELREARNRQAEATKRLNRTLKDLAAVGDSSIQNFLNDLK